MASLSAMKKKPFMAAILLFLGLLCSLEHIGLSLSLSLSLSIYIYIYINIYIYI
jgi:hypothetical protein